MIASPEGQPVGLVSVGNALFGTASSGGDISCVHTFCSGAAYELTPPTAPGGPWVLATLHNFGVLPDGGGPLASLITGEGGALYGTTLWGGSGKPCHYEGDGGGCGTVFQLTPPDRPGAAWTETVLYSFTGENGDGAFPYGPVMLGQNGALYGTTGYGGNAGACSYYGAEGCGTVFQLTPPAVPGGAWTETVLHRFSGVNGDGETPLSGLAMDASGVLYGTTGFGGTAGLGAVFSIVP